VAVWAAMVQPNHHAGQGPFDGIVGTLVGVIMLVGRGHDARLACELAAVGRDDKVVDIGCGPGVAAREAARRGADVTGVDPAPAMLRLARLLPRDGITYAQGTAEQLPMQDDTATVAWSLASAHHWSDVDHGIAEATRVLRSGGRLLVLERSCKEGAKGLASHGWTRPQAETFAAACERRGFSDVRVDVVRGRRGPAFAVTGHTASDDEALDRTDA